MLRVKWANIFTGLNSDMTCLNDALHLPLLVGASASIADAPWALSKTEPICLTIEADTRPLNLWHVQRHGGLLWSSRGGLYLILTSFV